MSKKFLEVFPDLNITAEMKELFKLVDVERVSAAGDRSSLRVYINSPRLIHKKYIRDLENGIQDQLFPGKKLTVKIQEKYTLSSQYNPQKLFQAYRDSLLHELKNYSIVEYNILRKAECTFPEECVLKMTVENNAVLREKTGELKRILEKIFFERCGLPVTVKYEYIEPSENLLIRQREAQIQKEIEERLRKNTQAADLPLGEELSGSKDLSSRPSSGDGARTEPLPAAGGDLPARGSSERSPHFSREGRKFGSYQKKSDNPDVLYGRDFEDRFIPVREIAGEMGEVTIRGKIIHTDSRLLNSGKTIVIFDITDFTDTITVKLFAREEALEDINKAVVSGQFLKLKGMTTIDKFDGELTIGSVVGIKKCDDFTGQRMDNSLVKRVELHCHTKMSDMDGVSDVKDIIKRAKKWGMPAIAVTDHGCVQAFPDAGHALDKNDDFKILYGVEGYLVEIGRAHV